MAISPRRLKRRADFLRVAGYGRKAVAPGLVLQAAPGRPGEIGLGLTVTRRVGGAVVRNRVRRRLRAAAGLVLPACAEPGHDYVLIGRAATLTRRFPALLADLEKALGRLGRRLDSRPCAPSARAQMDQGENAAR